MAVGRAANTSGLNLERIGVETLPNGTVPVEEDMSLRYPNVFACGDVAGPYQSLTLRPTRPGTRR